MQSQNKISKRITNEADLARLINNYMSRAVRCTASQYLRKRWANVRDWGSIIASWRDLHNPFTLEFAVIVASDMERAAVRYGDPSRKGGEFKPIVDVV